MTKLPLNTLNSLSPENKSEYRNIIDYGNKENFKTIVHNILEKGGDVNESIEEIKALEFVLDKEHFTDILDIFLNKTRINVTNLHVIYEILYSGLFNEGDLQLFETFYDKIWYQSDKSSEIANIIYKSIANGPFSNYKKKKNINILLEGLVENKSINDSKYRKLILAILESEHVTKKKKKEVIINCLDHKLKGTRGLIIEGLNLGLFNKSDRSYLKDKIKFLFLSNAHNHLYHTVIEHLFALNIFTRNDNYFFINVLSEIFQQAPIIFNVRSVEHLVQNLSKTHKNRKYITRLIDTHINDSTKVYLCSTLLRSGFYGAEDIAYIRYNLSLLLNDDCFVPHEHIKAVGDIMKGRLFNSEDTQHFKEIINSIFDETKNNFSYIYLIESILLSGAFSNSDETFLKELIEKSMKHIDTYETSHYLSVKILNTGFLNDEYVKEKSKILSKKGVDSDSKISDTTDFISSGLIKNNDIDYIRDIFDISLSKVETNESTLQIIQSILNGGFLEEKENIEKTLLVIKHLIADSESPNSSSYYMYYEIEKFFENISLHKDIFPYIFNYVKKFNTDVNAYPNQKQNTLLINIVNKVFTENSPQVISKEFGTLCMDKVFFGGNQDTENIHAVISILESDVIHKLDKKYLKNIFLIAFSSINQNAANINLVKQIINTNILSKNDILDGIHSTCDSTDHKELYRILPMLIDNLQYRDIPPSICNSIALIKEKYKDNFRNYRAIKRNITHDFTNGRFSYRSIELTKYLHSIFLSSEKMSQLSQFSYNENYDASIVIENIDKIVNNSKGMYYGYFIEAVKNCVIFPTHNTIGFPVTIDNFTNYMNDNDILFGYKKVNSKGTVPWSKDWFNEKTERKKYLEPDFMRYAKKFGLIPGSGNKAISGYAKNHPEKWEDLNNFIVKKVKPSNHATSVFTENHIEPSQNFNAIFNFFLENKKKSLTAFLQKLSFISENGISINPSQFKTINDFKTLNGEVDYSGLQNNFEKMLRINGEAISSRQLSQFKNSKRTKNNTGLEKMMVENLLVYIERIFLKKFKTKIISYFKETFGNTEINFSQIDESKFSEPLFIEAFKIMIRPTHNKVQIRQLLYRYLTGDFDIITDVNQYNTKKNKQWISENLNTNQTQVWLSSNKKTIILSSTDSEGKEQQSTLNIQDSIKNHVEISIKKITKINTFGFEFQTEFKTKGELIKEFNLKIKPLAEKINESTNSNLFQDLELQVNSIKKIDKNKNQTKKTSNSIIIEKELNPLKSLMMGNWVNGSCLSFYSDVKNYYSAITNTIDVNKGVFYIRDEKGILLGRVLVAIDKNKKMSRFKMYYSGSSDIDLNLHFDAYFRELAQKG